MKKLILILALGLFSVNTFAQEEINTLQLIGWWTPDRPSAHLFFWETPTGELKVQQISNVTGESFINRDFRINLESIFIKSSIKEEDKALNYYVMLENGTMECTSTNFYTNKVTKIIYTKTR